MSFKDTGASDYHARMATEAIPRLTVALTFDHDAISDNVRRGDPPVKMSHGEFGPRVGVPRILEVLEREAIGATFFVPGHSIETFPASVASIVERGHELATHGWFHEDFSTLKAKEQRAVLDRSIEAITKATGAPPTGHRAPYWALGPETLELVEAAGFRYDSSLMWDDYRLTRVRHGDRHSTDDGTTFGREGSLVEVPVYWALDDWAVLRTGTRPGWAVGAVARPRDLARRAPLRLRPRARRAADRDDASRVHRPGPPADDPRDAHRRSQGP